VNFAFDRSNQDIDGQNDNEGERPHPLESFNVDFRNVQDMQRLEELIRSIKTALEINEDSLKSLQSLNNKLHKLQRTSSASWNEVDIEAEQHLARISLYKRNFETLLGNVHGRSQLLYNVLDFRNALTVAYSTQRAVDISHLQANETAMMGLLNEMSLRDNIGVKILTLLATLYVPASFVAVSLPCIPGP
jgi:Mg2+ and Co2+ transporter CorA